MTINSVFSTYQDIEKNELKEILIYVANLTSTDFIVNKDREFTKEQEKKIIDIVNQKRSGKPLAYILKQRAFYNEIYYVNENVLIPQPDTEILVEEAIKIIKAKKEKDISILDLCTGSGCIGISVTNSVCAEKNIKLTLSDISSRAVEVAAVNAEKILKNKAQYEIFNGNLFETVKERKFDLILTNPPYIKTDIIPTLSKEVQTEPVLALDGGADGLELVRKIIADAPEYLNKNGTLLCEIGYDQGEETAEIFKENSFMNTEILKDLGMRNRVVKGNI